MSKLLSCLAVLCLSTSALAATDLFIPIYSTANNQDKTVGTIHVKQTDYGLLIEPSLYDLAPGEHAFAIHENPSCEHHGLAAGGDLDPHHTNKHLGPYNPNGHLGDLPTLYVAADGTAAFPILAPKILSIDEIKNRSFVIQANNKEDEISQRKRIACGVIS